MFIIAVMPLKSKRVAQVGRSSKRVALSKATLGSADTMGPDVGDLRPVRRRPRKQVSVPVSLTANKHRSGRN